MSENKMVKRCSLSKQVADSLEQMIEAGKYPVDRKIPTEVELMEMFSVSRNTVREAVRSLASSGFLEVIQGDGTYVRSANRFSANMNLKYAQESIDDIQEARNCLEVTISRLASERRTDEDLTEIEEALKKRQGLEDVSKENTLADIEFHMAIARACHNPILLDFYTSMSSYLVDHICERQNITDLNTAEIDELHEKLFIAIKNADRNEAGVCAHNILAI